MRIQEQRVGVPGGEVFACTWIPGEALHDAPVVLLHDSLGSVALWRDFPEALARCLGRPVVAYDRLGFGRSTARNDRPSVDFITEEAERYFPAIARALGITGFSLFGHSVGGAMALVIASQASACQWVVTESAQAFVEPRTLEGIRAAKAQFERAGQIERLARWHGDKARWVLDAWTQVWLSPAFASWNLETDANNVQCPALAIHGDQDEYGSVEFPKRIVAGVKGRSELVIMQGCGHVPHREQPERVLELVSMFVASVASRDASA